MEFHKQRRQQFLTQARYEGTLHFFRDVGAPGYLEELSSPDRDASGKRLVAASLADETFSTFMLRYTAGESLEELQTSLTEIVEAHERSAQYVQAHEKNPAFPPLQFIEIDEYERVVQIISLCYLLRRTDLLPRVASLFDPAESAQDTLYEDLLSYELEDRYEIDRWYHDAPYRDLINSMYRDSDEESIADLQRYLKVWYPSFTRAPWHDSHLNMGDDNCGAYFGYWALEAGAVAYLLELDDSSFRDHLVYPKDLVDFARQSDGSALQPSDSSGGLRVEGGEPCPQTGYWSTPAKQNSRRHFVQGEQMPTFDHSAYGATIWQWSAEQ